ncbi:MAG: hypothetical protein H8D78_06475 [Chloroflexi bacterium]|nr:hypothetical protein [Chloroflexota bacterium]
MTGGWYINSKLYQLRGWDENGAPTDAKLADLGLKR